jgi:hypothetical protein
MSKSECREAELWISCAIDCESLPAGARERLEAHLAVCGPCRDVRARGELQARRLRAALQPAPADLERLALLVARVRSDPAGLPSLQAGFHLGRRWNGVLWPVVGLAAAALVLVAVVPRKPDERAPASSGAPSTADAWGLFLELETDERVPLPAFDGSPLHRHERRWTRLRLPATGVAPLEDAPEERVKGLERVDTELLRLTSWPYQ